MKVEGYPYWTCPKCGYVTHDEVKAYDKLCPRCSHGFLEYSGMHTKAELQKIQDKNTERLKAETKEFTLQFKQNGEKP